MSIIRLKEYSRVGPFKMNQDQVRALRSFPGKINLEAGDDIGSYYLRSESWVGKLALPDMNLDIIPKVGAVNVLKMLLMGDEEAKPESVPSLNRISDSEDFWDLIGELLLSTVDTIIRTGMRREYVEFDDNSDVVRGQVLAGEDFLMNSPVRFGTFCRFAVLTPDIPVNQAMVWGLEVIGQAASHSLSHRLRYFMNRLEEISHLRRVPSILYQNEQGPYRTALFLVDLLRRSLQADASTFGLSGFGLMLDMNKVFEGYVRRCLRQKLTSYDLQIPFKGEVERDLCPGLKLKPDFLVFSGNTALAVCDCKYKLDWTFSQSADVYQMLAYLEGYEGVRSAFILFPDTKNRDICVEKIQYPRSGSLFRIGLPVGRLLESDIWDEVIQLLLSRNGVGGNL